MNEPENDPHAASALELADEDSSIDAMQTKEEDPCTLSARKLVNAYQKAARSTRLYPAHSAVLRGMMEEFAELVAQHVADYSETTLEVNETTLSWRETVLYEESDRNKSLAFRLFVNGIRLITLRPGIRRDEADGVVEVLTKALDRQTTTDDLRSKIWEHCFEHVDFVIAEELFNQREEEDFQSFAANPPSSMDGSAAAQAEAQVIWQRLLKADAPRAAIPTASDEALAELRAEAAAEVDRELFDDLALFLVAEFDGKRGTGVRTHIENFLEHLVASNEILRAARVLGTLQTCARGHPDPARRKVIQDALGKLAKTRVIPQLRPVLPTLDIADRNCLFRLVTALGEPAVAPLCDLLDSEYRDAARQALDVMAAEFPRALLAFVQHPKPQIARACLELLATQGDSDCVPGILPALRHPDVGVRREALRAIKQLGGKRAIALFLTALDDPGYEVRSLAIAALGEFGGPKASRALLARVEAKGFLGRSDFEKRETFRSLGLIGSPEVIVKLIQILATRTMMRRAKHDEVRALAASALGMIHTPATRNALEKHAKDKSDPVRRAVASAIHAFDQASSG